MQREAEDDEPEAGMAGMHHDVQIEHEAETRYAACGLAGGGWVYPGLRLGEPEACVSANLPPQTNQQAYPGPAPSECSKLHQPMRRHLLTLALHPLPQTPGTPMCPKRHEPVRRRLRTPPRSHPPMEMARRPHRLALPCQRPQPSQVLLRAIPSPSMAPHHH